MEAQNNIQVAIPGPGAYKINEQNSKVWGQKGIFGSCQKRFAQKNPNNEPDAGYYNPLESVKHLNQKLSFNVKQKSTEFLSKFDRLQKKVPISMLISK